MNIFSIFVLLSIFAGVSHAADFLVKDSDAIPGQGSIKLAGSDTSLKNKVETPAAKANGVEFIRRIRFSKNATVIDDEDRGLFWDDTLQDKNNDGIDDRYEVLDKKPRPEHWYDGMLRFFTGCSTPECDDPKDGNWYAKSMEDFKRDDGTDYQASRHKQDEASSDEEDDGLDYYERHEREYQAGDRRFLNMLD